MYPISLNGSTSSSTNSKGFTTNTTNPTTTNTSIYFNDTKNPLIAFVKPVFTSAAYNGFYLFYSNSSLKPQSYLIQTVPNTWGTSINAPIFINALVNDGYPSNRLVIISDIDVHFGRLFNIDGTPKYNILVFFHNEYVTMDEYQNMINFIKAGGNVIVLNGNAFYAEVDYNAAVNTVTLVYGHTWQFDGQNATPANSWRFWGTATDTEDINWLGSRFTLYGAGPTSGAYFRTNSTNPHPVAIEMLKLGFPAMAKTYSSHEENTLITRNAHIIADWKTSFTQPDYGLKIYEMFPDGPYGGSLIHFGFFGTDILPKDYASRLAFVIAARHQIGYDSEPWIRYPMDGAILSGDFIIDYTNNYTKYLQTDIFLNGISLGYIPAKTDLGKLSEGEYNLTIVFKSLSSSITRSVHFSVDRTPPEITIKTGSNTSLLTNYPVHPIQINCYDSHLSFMRIDANSELTPNYLSTLPVNTQQSLFTSFIVYPNTSSAVITYNITYPFHNGTWFFSVTSFDTAGNVEIITFNISINQFSNITGIIQPVITKINETTAFVVIPRIQSGYNAFLQTTSDNNHTWKTIPFINDPTNPNESLAYLVKDKNNPRIWFRVGIRNATVLTYIPYIRTYQWENAVVGVSATNITKIVQPGNTYFVDFKTSQYIAGNISNVWINGQFIPIYKSDQIHIDNISRYMFTVPKLTSNNYTLRIYMSFSTLNISFSFNLEIVSTTVISTSLLTSSRPIITYMHLTTSSNKIVQEILYCRIIILKIVVGLILL